MNTFVKDRGLRALVLAGASLSALMAAPAFAQSEEESADERSSSDTIVVTGSRLRSDGTLEAPSPVVAVGGDDIRTSGQIDITALLRESPQLQASLPGTFSAFNGTPLGASLLNLRNLGTERTLVVENGRRHVPGIEGTSSVDVNTISTALLERVDLMTGGASAVYGADAVTGVVNFILRDGSSFNGMEVRTQAGISGEGDAEEYFISLANGFESANGRADIVFAAEYQSTEATFAGDRDFGGTGRFSLVPNGPATGIDPRFSNVWLPNYRLPISSHYGIIALGDGGASAFVEAVLSGGVPGCDTIGAAAIPTCQIVDETGTLRPYNPGDIFIDGFNASGGDGVFAEPDDELLLPQTDRFLFQTAFSYELTPNMEFFADAKYVFTETLESNQVNGFNDDIPISADNPFIPAALQAQLATLQGEGLNPVIAVSRDTLDTTTRSNPVAERKTMRAVAGLRGFIPEFGFDYELSYSYGRTDADITSRLRIEDRFFAAIDAVIDPATGNVVCRSDIDPSAIVPPSSPYPAQNGGFQITTFSPGDGQCVPINIFGANTITQEAADFIFQPATAQNEIEQNNFLATLSGDSEFLFSLPAGPIGFVVGYEYRKDESAFTPDAFSAAGLTFGTINSNGGPTNASSGEIEVQEYFTEVKIPVLADLPFIENFELTGAYRYSDYDAFGETDTWSMGARWTIIDSLTVRSTLSRAVRIPNITEAFSPTFTVSLGASSDPCNPQFIDAGTQFRRPNCEALISIPVDTYNSTDYVSARIPGQSGGNPDLEPEEADSFTVGAVWRPIEDFNGLFEGLTVTVDYYKIEIDGLIDQLGAFDIAQNCVDAPTINNQFCAAIDRDPTVGFITGFRSGYVNLAAVETSGIDWRVDYAFDLPSMFGLQDSGQLRLSTLGTNFLSNEETRDVSAPEEVTDVLTTMSRPEWIFNLNATWSVGDLSLGWKGRYESEQLLSGIELDDLESDPDFANITQADGSWVHDFSISYFLKEELEIYGGINNAFDEEPYLGQLSRPAGPRGRFFYAGVNATF
ncbi:TonB-dependent receptor plug domain-containing protein [Oceanicaulis alexandrii]|uniref:TonB-dependent receptor plug domain-containing protein n=1 Tax=Oceanicaulis alexandrii TaxID=153233 RepID=UPI003BAE44E1